MLREMETGGKEDACLCRSLLPQQESPYPVSVEADRHV